MVVKVKVVLVEKIMEDSLVKVGKPSFRDLTYDAPYFWEGFFVFIPVNEEEGVDYVHACSSCQNYI